MAAARAPSSPVVVIGAGLAGLVCARELIRAGRNVVLLEAQDGVGGRVRTDITPEGFRIDRGFQVLFAAYPALLRQVRLEALEPRYLVSDMLVAFDGRMETLGHPLYAPWSLPGSVSSGLVGPADVAALARFGLRSMSLGDAPLLSTNRAIGDEMRALGVGEAFFRRVVAPFFGGTSLDRSLSSDATFLGLVFRSMAVGRVFLPARGVQRLPEAVAAEIPHGAFRFGTRVERIEIESGRAVGVHTSEGPVEASAVVVATEAPEAARLTGVSLPEGKRSCVTVYLETARPLYEGGRLALNGEGSLVNHLLQMTNVAPAYAPPGRHLVAADIVGEIEESDDVVSRRAIEDIGAWFPGANTVPMEAVRVVRVPYSQFAQPPGIYETLPGSRTDISGLFLGGEYLHSSSIQGALRGGEIAAQAVLG